MRRTVATLLVVASPLLLAAPVGAAGGRPTGPAAVPAAPAAGEAVVPAAPVTVAPPAVPAAPAAPVVAVPAVPAPARAASAVRPVVRALGAKAPTARGIDDAAYAAQLQADLCLARAIFCGLDRNGRYPAH